jgi:hypothetical protein
MIGGLKTLSACDNLVLSWTVAARMAAVAIKVKPDERNTKRGDTNVIFSLLFHNNETVLDLPIWNVYMQDNEGCFVLVKTLRFSQICTIDVGEAPGLLHAITWVHELQLEEIDFALDSKVVDYFYKGTNTNNVIEFGDILKECKNLSCLYSKT